MKKVMYLFIALTVGAITLGSCEETEPLPEPEIVDSAMEGDDDEDPDSIPPTVN